MSELSLDTIINISVSQAGAGVNEYNTSNLMCLTHEVPVDQSEDFALYNNAPDVETAWGSGSRAYAAALQVFSQAPNILANQGQLIVAKIAAQVQSLTFSLVPDGGAIKLNYNGTDTASIPHGSINASGIQSALRLVAGLEKVVVTSVSSTVFHVQMLGLYNPITLTSDSNTLVNGITAVTLAIAVSTAQQTVGEALSAYASQVQYFGAGPCLTVSEMSSTDAQAAAVVMQALNKMLFIVNELASVPDDIFTTIVAAKLSHCRCLNYTRVNDVLEALGFQFAYAGRGLSVIFEGSNTTITMHLKDLVNVLPDTSISAVAVTDVYDSYPSFQGVGKVYCAGANQFFDQVYNLLWYVGALQVEAFNLLAQTSTKIVQTEQGMDSLKAAYRRVSELAVANQYLAPGQWTRSETFGVQADFFANISQRGYYIYSAPVAQQLASSRANREAPLVQIAAKEAGAIQSSNVLIYVNK